MNSMVFSLLANSSPEVDENKRMELTFGSLSFYVGPSGSTCLSGPAKSGPSTSKTKIIAKSGSSVGSSSEANLPVSLAATENMQEKFEEPNEIGRKFIMEAAIDKPRDFTSGSSSVSRSVHQLCVIITEAAEEENNHVGNEEVDMQVDKLRSNGKKEKEKVHVSAGEWRMIMSAINHGTDVPRRFKKRSFNGISIRVTPTQKEVKAGKRYDYEKPRLQQHIKWRILE
jgi:hypothetical protein